MAVSAQRPATQRKLGAVTVDVGTELDESVKGDVAPLDDGGHEGLLAERGAWTVSRSAMPR